MYKRMGKISWKKAKIRILRVYELDKTQILKRSNGMLYANVVKLEGKADTWWCI